MPRARSPTHATPSRPAPPPLTFVLRRFVDEARQTKSVSRQYVQPFDNMCCHFFTCSLASTAIPRARTPTHATPSRSTRSIAPSPPSRGRSSRDSRPRRAGVVFIGQGVGFRVQGFDLICKHLQFTRLVSITITTRLL